MKKIKLTIIKMHQKASKSIKTDKLVLSPGDTYKNKTELYNRNI